MHKKIGMCSLKNNPFKFIANSQVMVRDGHDQGCGLMVQSQFNPLQFEAYFINPASFLLAYRLVSFLVETC